MKKNLTLFLFSLLSFVFATSVCAQQNVYVWKNGGNLSVFSSENVDSVSFPTQQNVYIWKNGGNLSVLSSENVDSVSFSADPWLFNITTSKPDCISTNSIRVTSSVSLNENVASLSVRPEVGICYSDVNPWPTYENKRLLLGSEMDDYTVCLENLTRGTTYYYRTYVKILDDVFYDKNICCITTLNAVVVYGHKFIDLGLPSRLLWAECNIGASSPNKFGDYYAWGETETKSNFSWSNYKWDSTPTKYTPSDGKSVLEETDDVATVKWGKACRMPSQSDFEELYNNCEWTWRSDYFGTSGYLIKGPNLQTIFLPAARYSGSSDLDTPVPNGSYWSSSLKSNGRSSAYYLFFRNGHIEPSSDSNRYCGHSVRPVAKACDTCL